MALGRAPIELAEMARIEDMLHRTKAQVPSLLAATF
jgi:hypothetical protein